MLPNPLRDLTTRHAYSTQRLLQPHSPSDGCLGHDPSRCDLLPLHVDQVSIINPFLHGFHFDYYLATT